MIRTVSVHCVYPHISKRASGMITGCPVYIAGSFLSPDAWRVRNVQHHQEGAHLVRLKGEDALLEGEGHLMPDLGGLAVQILLLHADDLERQAHQHGGRHAVEDAAGHGEGVLVQVDGDLHRAGVLHGLAAELEGRDEHVERLGVQGDVQRGGVHQHHQAAGELRAVQGLGGGGLAAHQVSSALGGDVPADGAEGRRVAAHRHRGGGARRGDGIVALGAGACRGVGAVAVVGPCTVHVAQRGLFVVVIGVAAAGAGVADAALAFAGGLDDGIHIAVTQRAGGTAGGGAALGVGAMGNLRAALGAGDVRAGRPGGEGMAGPGCRRSAPGAPAGAAGRHQAAVIAVGVVVAAGASAAVGTVPVAPVAGAQVGQIGAAAVLALGRKGRGGQQHGCQ